MRTFGCSKSHDRAESEWRQNELGNRKRNCLVVGWKDGDADPVVIVHERCRKNRGITEDAGGSSGAGRS